MVEICGRTCYWSMGSPDGLVFRQLPRARYHFCRWRTAREYQVGGRLQLSLLHLNLRSIIATNLAPFPSKAV